METRTYKLLSELNDDTPLCTLKVLLFDKLDPQESQSSPTKFQRFFFVDEKGKKIQGTIFKEQIEILAPQLELGSTYYISNVIIKRMDKRWQIVDNEYQITLTWRTIIEAVSEEARIIPKVEYDFVPFDNLEQYINSATNIDVVGVVLHITPNQTRKTKFQSGIVSLSEILLVDKKLQPINLSLWNGVGINECNILEQLLSNSTPVIIATSVKAQNNFQGISLSNKKLTKILINPFVAEVEDLQSWSKDNEAILKPLKSKKPYSFSSTSNICSLPEANLVTIDEAMETTNMGMLFRIKASISLVATQKQIWYYGCSECTRKVEVVDKIPLNCKKCNVKPEPRFNIRAEIKDSSNSTWVTLFGLDGEKLMSTTALELKELEDVVGNKIVEAKAKKCIDNEYIFHVKCFNETFQGKVTKKLNIVRMEEVLHHIEDDGDRQKKKQHV